MSTKPCFTVTASVSCLVSACITSPAKVTGLGDREPPPFAAHWVHDAALREIMAEMDRDRAALWPQEIEERYKDDAERRARRHLDDVERIARKLAETAKLIPGAVADVSIAEADRRSFFVQAQTLHEQALRLAASAAANDENGARTVLVEIEQSCNSCHRRFRDFAGPLRTAASRSYRPAG